MLNAKYTFLPWLKKGLSLYSSTEDNHSYQANVAGRPQLDVTLTVNQNLDVTKQVALVGPGDVVGFQSGSILKSWPQPNTPDFQPNHLCFIEFFEEDLPWRYTPAVASSSDDKARKLRPWMALVVLESSEYNEVTNEELPFPTLQVSSGVIQNAFPSQSELWAWGHVHVNGHFDAISDLKDLADGEGARVYARIMCPRKLKAHTAYKAFLIPSFEAGRKVGIGEEPYGTNPVDILAPAWNKENPASGTISFPVYHSWEFATSENDDFESVIDRLVPQPIPPEVGNLNLDVRQMGPGIDMGSNQETEFVGMPGALKSPTTVPNNWSASERTLFKNQLTAWLNQADILRQDGTFTHEGGLNLMYEDTNDPVIVPPTYARYHALIDRIRHGAFSSVVENPDWIKELNLEIRNRVAASIGASIIREKQEDFMDAAWEQVGEIQEANQRIIQTELAKNANYEAYRKFVFETDDGKIIELTGPIVNKLLAGNQTVWKQITGSTLPKASLSGQFRSKKKPRGKKATLINSTLSSQVEKPNFQHTLVKNLADDQNKPLVNAAQQKTAPATFPKAQVVADASAVVSSIESAYESDPNYTNASFPEPATGSGGETVSGNTFAAADTFFTSLTPDTPLDDLEVEQTTGTIQQAMDPKVLQAKRLNSMLGNIGGSFKIVDESYRFKPVLATPEFEIPTYELLKEKSIDLFMPNLDRVPDNSISLLESNYEFIEAFLTGMSNEMGKELLWRSFPTDQRGTNFKYFWERFDPSTFEAVPDISAIHTWPFNSSLGDSSHRPADTANPAIGLVLMLRGDLLKRYPNTVLFAQKASNDTYETREPLSYEIPENRKYPILEAKIEPDISFFGFDISKEEALGDAQGKGGWYFVFQERPGEMAFGFDKADTVEATSKDVWENIDWDDMLPGGMGVLNPNEGPTMSNDIPWGENAADIAYALFQKPVRVAIHAAKMIERT